MGSLLDTFGGLPVHALVVHAVVVLVPLAAVGAMVMVVWRSFSRRFGPLVVIVSGVAAVSAFVAKESGEQLVKRVGAPPAHVDLGKTMPLVAGALFVLLLVFWLFDRGVPLNRARPGWLMLLGFAVVVLSLFAIYWTVRTGHSGSESVWTGLLARN